MKTITALAILLLTGSVSWADVVELKTGERIEGKFEEATSFEVIVVVGGKRLRFEREKVRAIYFGSTPAAAAPARMTGAGEAVEVLRGLRSVTGVGVSYQEYSRRLLDAKVVVDRFLQARDRSDPQLGLIVGQAMQYYTWASSTWSNRFGDAFAFRDAEATSRAAQFSDFPLEQCHPVLVVTGREHWSASMSVQDLRRTVARIIIGATPGTAELLVPALWSCGSDKTAEAERLLAGR